MGVYDESAFCAYSTQNASSHSLRQLTMWKDWINGILGIWIVFLAFLGLPFNTRVILMIITGLLIAFLSFWKGASCAADKRVSKEKEKLSVPTEERERII